MPQDPVVTETTDIMRAVLLQLRASTDIVALVSTRIATEIQDDWAAGASAIMVRRAGGGSIADVRHETPRYDIWGLGSNGVEAERVLRRVRAWLLPHPTNRPTSFKQAGCVVYDVKQDGGESYRSATKEEPWAAVIQAFVFEASEVPL